VADSFNRKRPSRTDKLRFLVAVGGPFVPAIKDARDEQPNDRQRQSEDDKRHRGADNYCEHEYPQFHIFCTSSRQLVEHNGQETEFAWGRPDKAHKHVDLSTSRHGKSTIGLARSDGSMRC
jgi:hypothetical protein